MSRHLLDGQRAPVDLPVLAIVDGGGRHQIDGWARPNGIEPRRVRHLQSPRDLEGLRPGGARIVMLSFPRRFPDALHAAWIDLHQRGFEVETAKGPWTDYDGPGDSFRSGS